VLSLDKFCTVQTSRGCPIPAPTAISLPGRRRWRSRSPEHVLGELQELSDAGYRSIYLTDDHFLINRKRIEAICKGMIERKLLFRWGCEGRADSVGIDQLPIMRQAGCDFLAFGVEAGTQKVLDRLKKKQTIAQVEHAVREAKRQGIGRCMGSLSSARRTKPRRTSCRASDLRLDWSWTPLVSTGFAPIAGRLYGRNMSSAGSSTIIVTAQMVQMHDIDPTTVRSEVVNRLRSKGYGLLFLHRIFKRPIRTWKLLRAFGRHMKTSDIIQLLASPFRRAL